MGTASVGRRPVGTALWAVALVVVILVGLALPPLGAVAAVVLAIAASRAGRRDVRAAGIVLAIAFVLLTIFVGVFLLDVGGGTEGSTSSGGSVTVVDP
jgi:hypothetical protein